MEPLLFFYHMIVYRIQKEERVVSPNRRIGVLGGDRRQYYIAKLLQEEGIDVMLYAVEAAAQLAGTERPSHITLAKSLSDFMEYTDLVIGPIPFSRDGSCIYAANNEGLMDSSICAGGLDTFCTLIRQDQIIAGGYIPEQVLWTAGESGAECFDFMKSEQVALENAVATAEGTIAEVICESDRNLCQSHCIVFGYGRCAKALAERLNGMKAYVTIAARNETQLQEARNKGYETIRLSTLKNKNLQEMNSIREADYLFNTIPAPVITREVLGLLNSDTFIIDIASKPGGTDFAACKHLGIHAKLSLGIPGRYAARTSAQILLRAVRHMLFPSPE